MATSRNQISFQSAPGEQTKVIFDRKGNAVSLSSTNLGLFTGFTGQFYDTVVPSEVITTVGPAFFSKGSPLANATTTPIPEVNSYSPTEDFRVEFDLYLQNLYLGLNGSTVDPRSGSTVGTNGDGFYIYNETVEQSDISPVTLFSPGADGPDYDNIRKKFGVSSIRCKGEGGFKVPHTALTGGIAFEFFFLYLGATPTTDDTIFAKGEDPSAAGGGETLEFRYFGSQAGVAGVTEGMYFGINGVNIFAAPATALTQDMWHHAAIAITPNQATKVKTFLNGSMVSSYTSGITIYNYTNSPFSIATDSTGFAIWPGWIDDFIIKAGGGETTGYMARYTGTTFSVPTESATFDPYVKYHFTFDGTNGGQLFNVRTGNSTFAEVAKFDESGILRVRKTRNYGTSTGFTTGFSGAFIHGMSSGAMYPLSYVVDLGVTLGIVQQIAAGEQANDFLEIMQSIITSTDGYFPTLLGNTSGFTGPANAGISGQFGLSGSGPTYSSFTFIPSKDNLDYVSTFVNSVNTGIIPRTSLQTYPVADSSGNILFFTVPDMMNLFKDLMRIYTSNESVLGANNNYIKTTATKSGVNKVSPYTKSELGVTLSVLDVGELGGGYVGGDQPFSPTYNP